MSVLLKPLRAFECAWVPNKALAPSLAFFTLVHVVQSILGLIFGWDTAWRVASAVGLLGCGIPIRVLYSFSYEVRRKYGVHMSRFFVLQQIGAIVAINFATNKYDDTIGIIINSICLTTSVFATHFSIRFMKVLTESMALPATPARPPPPSDFIGVEMAVGKDTPAPPVVPASQRV